MKLFLGRAPRGEDVTQGVAGEALLDDFSHVEGRRDGSQRGTTVRQTLVLRPLGADGTTGPQQKLQVWIQLEIGESLGTFPLRGYRSGSTPRRAPRSPSTRRA